MRPGGRGVGRTTVVGVAAAAATVSALAVGGIALADSQFSKGDGAAVAGTAPTPTAEPTGKPTDKAAPKGKAMPKEKRAGVRPGHPGGPARLGLAGGALHGEFVVPKKGGGYQTVASQRGTVESISSSAVTVRSEDGYRRAYAIDDTTTVAGGRAGVGSIKEGSTVAVVATVSGDKATAVRVVDVSRQKAAWKDLRPGQGKPGREPGPGQENGGR
ncbi:hypothetical protein [Actinopolymorpha pittospori]